MRTARQEIHWVAMRMLALTIAVSLLAAAQPFDSPLQLIWSSTEAELLAEVRSAYDGEVVSAHDLEVF